VKCLLDTHALLWWLDSYTALPPKILTVLKEGRDVIYVSAATAWEISIKKSLKKLKAPDNLEEAMAANRFLPLPISIGHALHAGRLPRHHDDPFDRMLVAQAQIEQLTLITHDSQISRYAVSTLWE